MGQPNIQDGRNCWASARERNRLRARFHIRERVSQGETITSKSSCSEDADPSVIADYVRYVQAGDRSKFSLSKLDRHFDLVSSTLPIEMLQYTRPGFEMNLQDHSIQLCTAWFGIEYASALQIYIQSLQTFTLLEYAVWMGKYGIVGAFLVAGINPCLRGTHRQQSTDADQTIELGARVLQRFFDCFPILLSTYIVKRIVELRRDAWEFPKSDSTCRCGRETGLLLFRKCQHRICEACFWKDFLEHIDRRGELDDVVVCPYCHTSSDTSEMNSENTHSTPQQRKVQSLSRFLALPLDRQALKSSPGKKKKLHEQEQWASSWTAAVMPSLGSTQTVRRDKFSSFVERNAVHYVRGCLYAGVDVDETNEYGQTALFVSAWRGNYEMTHLLLSYGADPKLVPNDGISPFEISSRLGHMRIRDLLQESVELIDGSSPSDDFSTLSQPISTVLSTLIAQSSDHPGAGSYTIDDALSIDQVEWLVHLHRRLPIDTAQKKKMGLCSERSYFCDASGHIQKALQATIVKAGFDVCDSIQVFPHMRFLDYSIVGTTLNPHVDICRVDPCSGVRSTHTFIVYLNDCDEGGETCLLEDLSNSSGILASISPKRGRLLLFPHNCPHEGKEVLTVPKLLLRGEVRLSPKMLGVVDD